MKKIVLVMLTVFCFFAVTPNVFARPPKFVKMLFFESGGGNSEEVLLDVRICGADSKYYQTEFPKSKTHFVHALAVLQFDEDNLFTLDEGIELMFRYYNPDGSLFWEGKYKQWPGCFDDSPGSFSGMISCGWEQPGNWPVGTYTVKVWMEGNFLGQGSFKIYEDRDPIDIGKKVAMSGELKQTKKKEPYWIKRSSSSSATHSFRVMFYVNKNWVIFFEMPKSKSGELIMWVKDRSSNPYKKRVSTSDNKKKSYGPVTKSEFEQAAWRILKYFDY